MHKLKDWNRQDRPEICLWFYITLLKKKNQRGIQLVNRWLWHKQILDEQEITIGSGGIRGQIQKNHIAHLPTGTKVPSYANPKDGFGELLSTLHTKALAWSKSGKDPKRWAGSRWRPEGLTQRLNESSFDHEGKIYLLCFKAKDFLVVKFPGTVSMEMDIIPTKWLVRNNVAKRPPFKTCSAIYSVVMDWLAHKAWLMFIACNQVVFEGMCRSHNSYYKNISKPLHNLFTCGRSYLYTQNY